MGEGLLGKPEDLGSIPPEPMLKTAEPGAHTCNSSLEEVETSGSWELVGPTV